MTEVWALPGYDVQELLGFGGTGEVWRARELATGDLVALKRLREDADPVHLAALRREAVVLQSLETPYVVGLRAVLGEGAKTVLVLDLARGGSLAALLARRGHLDPGEVVTIAGPLAQALAAVHAAGIVHADLTPANVLFSETGMPMLADLGLARFADDTGAVDGTAEYVDPAVAAGAIPNAASDVWALGAICHHLLAGTPPHDGGTADDVLAAVRSGGRAPLGLLAPAAPRPLVTAIEQALVPDPGGRPDADAFAAAVRRSHAAAPVRLAAGSASPPDVRPTHAVHGGALPAPASSVRSRRPPRRVVIAATASLVLALAALAGWASGRRGPVDSAQVPQLPAATSTPAARTSPAPKVVKPDAPPAIPDWRRILERLDEIRADALERAEPAVLTKVYAGGSPGLAADTAALLRLRTAGLSARGVRHEFQSVQQTSYDGKRAVLRVVDALAAYDVVDAAGDVVRSVPARSGASYIAELQLTPQGWRLRQMRAA